MTYKIKRKISEGYIPLSDEIEKQLDKWGGSIIEEDKFQKSQLETIDSLRKLAKESSFMEKEAIIESLKPLSDKIFNLSFKDAMIKSNFLEKDLCKELQLKWNSDDGHCEVKK